MTPRISMRARAREVYGEMATVTAAADPCPTPPSLSLPLKGGGDEGGHAEQTGKPEPGAGAASLTSRVRDLYENSALPVREIARLCGVTDRTIYKYARKGGWKPRYRWNPDGTRPAAFASAKGAGGRFIRREDKGKAFATGLKALDPSGRERALVACRRAKSLSRAAQAEAQKEAKFEAFLKALAGNARLLADLRHHRQSYAQGRMPSDLQRQVEGFLLRNVEWSTRRLALLMPDLEAMFQKRARPAPPPPVRASAVPRRVDPDDVRAWT